MKNILHKIAFALMALSTISFTNSFRAFAQTIGTVTDVDGNTYKTMKIGNQTWMLENLRTNTYNDGTPIASISEVGDLRKTTLPAYSVHNSNPDYGNLYNWFAVNTNKLAPKGWRVPSKQDWEILMNYLKTNNQAAGERLKAASWSNSANPSGFEGLPAGYIGGGGGFNNVGNAAFWWCTRERNAGQADYYKIMTSLPSAFSNGANKQFFMSVRCIKN